MNNQPNTSTAFYCIDHPMVDAECAACELEGSSGYTWLTKIDREHWLYCSKHRIRCHIYSGTPRDDGDARSWAWLQHFIDAECFGPIGDDTPAQIAELIEAEIKRRQARPDQ